MTVCCSSFCLSESVNTLPGQIDNHLATSGAHSSLGSDILMPFAVVVNGLAHLFYSCYVRSKSMLKVPLNIYARCRVIGKNYHPNSLQNNLQLNGPYEVV